MERGDGEKKNPCDDHWIIRYTPQLLAGMVIAFPLLTPLVARLFHEIDMAAWYGVIFPVWSIALTLYTALYAVAWAQYEFEFTRIAQKLNLAQTLVANGNTKGAAPLLVKVTQSTLLPRPVYYSVGRILTGAFPVFHKHFSARLEQSLASKVPPFPLREEAIDLIRTYNWSDAILSSLNLAGVKWVVKKNWKGESLEGAIIKGGNFEGSVFESNLEDRFHDSVRFGGSSFINSKWNRSKIRNSININTRFDDSCLIETEFSYINNKLNEYLKSYNPVAYRFGMKRTINKINLSSFERSIIINSKFEENVSIFITIDHDNDNSNIHAIDCFEKTYILESIFNNIKISKIHYFGEKQLPKGECCIITKDEHISAIVDVFCECASLYGTRFPENIHEKIKEKRPSLFEWNDGLIKIYEKAGVSPPKRP